MQLTLKNYIGTFRYKLTLTEIDKKNDIKNRLTDAQSCYLKELLRNCLLILKTPCYSSQ